MKYILAFLTILVLLTLPAIAQDQNIDLTGKFLFIGAGYDPTSLPNTQGLAGMVNPLSDRFALYTAAQISAIPGTQLKNLQPSSLHIVLKAGPMIKAFNLGQRVTVWGLMDAGLAAGGTAPTTTVPLSGAFAYGAVVDISFNRFGIDPIFQRDWDQKTGSKFVYYIALRYKF